MISKTATITEAFVVFKSFSDKCTYENIADTGKLALCNCTFK